MKRMIFLCLAIFIGFLIGKVSLINEVKEKELVLKDNNTLSMMLETDYNSNNYVPSTSNEWPTSGYIFNEELSRCEYGSKLTWDDTSNEVLMIGNSSDKCYVYFDKYQLPIINSSSAVASGTSIVITIDATAGTSAIDSYYYSIDNGQNYIKDTSNTHTFSNLSVGTYNVKYYVKDMNGKKSEIISKELSIIPTLTNYVISQYTGTQGENNLYYHNGTILDEDGNVIDAGDNSYRYAGAHDEVNNFVCFGSDDETCPDDNLYRIIGVFRDQVKLIKWDYATSELLGTDGDYKSSCSTSSECSTGTNKGTNAKSSIGAYMWNISNAKKTYSATNYYNVWHYSKLNTVNLNTNFLNNIGNTCVNKIAETTWKVGGNIYENMYQSNAQTAYTNEITSPSTQVTNTYESKVGLMYVSDYYYGASPTYWTYPGYSSSGASYDYRAAIGENWMYMGLVEFTVVRETNNNNLVFSIGHLGNIGSTNVYNGLHWCGVRPVFYLNSDVTCVSGSGSKTDPYRIS